MADTQEATTRWLALVHAPTVDAPAISSLLNHFGTVDALFEAPMAHLRKLGLVPALREWIAQPDSGVFERDLAWLAAPEHHLVSYTDPRYPPLLKEITDAPIALFVAGDPSILERTSLAIVGSRNPSPDGRDNAHAFAAHLAAQGMVIVSGLAAGIDAAAHKGAMSASGLTIAVMGTGPDQVYPESNHVLAAEIAAHGAVVTEFPCGTPAQRGNFPRRNRIISGLTVGTLVVEAALRSGSLITARLAAEQGREVFAIPGSIHNPMSKGCHRLIRQGAKLVDDAGHILEELGQFAGSVARLESDPEAAPELDDDYKKLLDCMGDAPVSVDKLVERSGLTPAVVSSMLLIMELRGLVESTSGGRYARHHKRP